MLSLTYYRPAKERMSALSIVFLAHRSLTQITPFLF